MIEKTYEGDTTVGEALIDESDAANCVDRQIAATMERPQPAIAQEYDQQPLAEIAVLSVATEGTYDTLELADVANNQCVGNNARPSACEVTPVHEDAQRARATATPALAALVGASNRTFLNEDEPEEPTEALPTIPASQEVALPNPAGAPSPTTGGGSGGKRPPELPASGDAESEPNPEDERSKKDKLVPETPTLQAAFVLSEKTSEEILEAAVEEESAEKLAVTPRFAYEEPLPKIEVLEDVDDQLRSLELPDIAEASEHAFEAEIEGLRACKATQAAELGLDISNRLPPSENITLYSTEEFEKIRIYYSRPRDSKGTSLTSGHILCELENEPSQSDRMNEKITLQRIGHELGHNTAFTSVAITPNEQLSWNVTFPQMGYMDTATGKYKMLTEIMIELANLDAQRNFWITDSALCGRMYDPGIIAYPEASILLDGILSRLPDPRQAFDELHRGLLLGDRQVLRVIEKAVGPHIMQGLATMETEIDILSIALQLNYPEVSSRLDGRNFIDLCDWM